jgi:hypothetical protein
MTKNILNFKLLMILIIFNNILIDICHMLLQDIELQHKK